jgi:hypothetical protein
MIRNTVVSQALKKTHLKLSLTLISTVLLAACSGGGDSSSSGSSSGSPTLNLNAAFEKKTIGGSSISGTISGYCQGDRVWTLAPTSSGTTLNGTTPALIQNEYELDTMAANSNTFCTNFYKSNNISTVKATNYYDPSTIVPISNGSNPPTTVYRNQVPLPTSVTAGSSGTWFNTISLADGVIPAATSIQTWAVTADSPTTLTLITNNKAYLTVGYQLLFNQTTWYPINADNTLTSLRKNIQVTELGVTVFSGGAITLSGDQSVDEVYQQPFSSPTLNLNAAYTSWVKGGSTISGTIFGYCQGTRQQTFTPTVSGHTLSSAAALITNETETDTIPASSNAFCKSFYKYDGSTSTPYYFDPTLGSTYVTPITSGATTQNGDPLGLVWSNQAAPPTSVTTGATGTLATYINYGTNPLDSSRSIPENEGSRTWMILADTTTTLMYVTIDTAKIYSLDGKGPLIYTSITNYRINANNTLTPLFKQVQATNIATSGQGNQTIYENYKQ